MERKVGASAPPPRFAYGLGPDVSRETSLQKIRVLFINTHIQVGYRVALLLKNLVKRRRTHILMTGSEKLGRTGSPTSGVALY